MYVGQDGFIRRVDDTSMASDGPPWITFTVLSHNHACKLGQQRSIRFSTWRNWVRDIHHPDHVWLWAIRQDKAVRHNIRVPGARTRRRWASVAIQRDGSRNLMVVTGILRTNDDTVHHAHFELLSGRCLRRYSVVVEDIDPLL